MQRILKFEYVQLGLRARVAALFALLGFVVSACLSLIAVHFSDSYVHRLIDQMLRVEGEYLNERYKLDGRTPHPRTKHFYVYTSGSDARNLPPPELAALDTGIYEVEDKHGERHIAVYTNGKEKLYVVLDIGLESARERRFVRDLIALVVCGTLLSAWLGWFAAGRAIEPVRRLAFEVEQLQPSSRQLAKLAPNFAADEVGALAHAFDRHHEKLHEYIRRERAFTADASHELRTPLAVIRGAVEVLLDNERCSAATAARLKRVQRGTDELRDLLDALLVLARSDDRAPEESCTPDLGALVNGLLGERKDALQEKHLRVEHESAPHITIAAPPKVLSVVIANLLRAVTEFANHGTLQVKSAPNALTIAHLVDESCAPPAVRNTSITGAPLSQEPTLGLGMIRRVCARWGWSLEETNDPKSYRAFVLRFREDPRNTS